MNGVSVKIQGLQEIDKMFQQLTELILKIKFTLFTGLKK